MFAWVVFSAMKTMESTSDIWNKERLALVGQLKYSFKEKAHRLQSAIRPSSTSFRPLLSVAKKQRKMK